MDYEKSLYKKPEKIQVKRIKKVVSQPALLKKCQKVFNEFIRLRDKNKPCISCGSRRVAHASHFYSMGKHSNVRFNEDNVHGSCVYCNTYLHGNLIEYANNLPKRIGEKKYELLKAMKNQSKKWERFELEVLIQMYSLKVKQLKD